MKQTAQPSLSMETIRKIVVPLPPLLEQDEIVEVIKRFLYGIHIMEMSIKRSREQSKRLRSSILNVALEGKLVPQDPNDEPAEILLERIKCEKSKVNGLADPNK